MVGQERSPIPPPLSAASHRHLGDVASAGLDPLRHWHGALPSRTPVTRLQSWIVRFEISWSTMPTPTTSVAATAISSP